MKLEGEEGARSLDELLAKRAQEHDEMLAKAKEEAAKVGKEPFDLDKLDQLWMPPIDDPELYENEAPSRRAMRHRSYEWYYYVLAPEIHTIAALARHLAAVDMYRT